MSIFSKWWEETIKGSKDYYKDEKELWDNLRKRVDSYVGEKDDSWFVIVALNEIFMLAATTKDKERTAKVMTNIINWLKENGSVV